MERPVFFIDHLPENTITLNEDTSKHVVQVLRMKPGEQLHLTDGAGSLLKAEIIDDHKKKCTVGIIDRNFQQRKARKISIAISLVKNNSRFEWFLEKATEIGVTEIIPLLCARTEKQHFRYDRMKQILISAMMQSKQVWLPVLPEPVSLDRVCSTSNYQTKLIAHCMEDQKQDITEYRQQDSLQILIGPEGDFTNEEIKMAIEFGYVPVSLGSTRLRTETAGMVAASLLSI